MSSTQSPVDVNFLTSTSQPHQRKTGKTKLLLSCCIGLNLLASATAEVSSLPSRERNLKAVTKFILFDVNSGEDIAYLYDGAVVNINGMEGKELNIKANTTGSGIKRLIFTLNDGVGNIKTRSRHPPYVMCSGAYQQQRSCSRLREGHFSVTADIHWNGDPLTVNFSIVREAKGNNEKPRLGMPTPSTSPPRKSGSSTCSVPQFDGGWIQGNPEYPLGLAETQGAMIGNDLVIVSGFHEDWGKTTDMVFKLDTKSFFPSWIEQDKIPFKDGISHTGFVTVGQKLYICNGFLGGHPGPATNECYVYDNEAAHGSQWEKLPFLPQARGGGGLAYIEGENALLFAGGAVRTSNDWVDYHDAWILDLDHVGTVRYEWVPTSDIPFATNHLSAVTARDGSGASRIYFMGGQKGHDEGDSEIDDLYEFVPGMDTWVKRANMPITRGHASSSTIDYGCGFIIIGGTQRGKGQVTDISYYDTVTDTWTNIGNLPKNVNTPVCDISLDVRGEDWLYCETGKFEGYSYKRKINTGWDQQG